MGRVTSREAPADEFDRSKEDPESGVPSPDNEPRTLLPPATTAPIERIPTYLQPRLPWRDRLLHFTFAWYTVTYVLSKFPSPYLPSPQKLAPSPYLGPGC